MDRVVEAGAINRELWGQLMDTCLPDIASRSLVEAQELFAIWPVLRLLIVSGLTRVQ